jgi:hypothetical protein|tara:strand:- start:1060 stop:1269 length:210 start_codon:yes stop_codon:yes gene_type:complete
MHWMIIKPSLEQKLNLECTCRRVSEETDVDYLQSLCIALIKQNWHQAILLKQAVEHIAHLDSLDLDKAA